MNAAVRWRRAEVLSIQSAGLRELAEESAQAGDTARAGEFAELADRAEAALVAAREAER